MAFTSILAVGSGAATSADVTIAAGAAVPFVLKGALGVIPLHGVVHIQAKGDDGLYYTVHTLHEGNRSQAVNGPGIFRLSRPVSSGAVGVTHDIS